MKPAQPSYRLIAALVLLGISAVPANAQDWQWTLTPYLWASASSLDVTVNDEPVIGGDLSFSDLLDKTDFAGQVHFEGQRGKGGFFLDVTFLNLGETQTTPANPPLPGGTDIHADMKLVMFEGAGIYRPGGGSHGLDFLLGVRVIDMDVDLGITPPPPLPSTTASASDSFVDGFAGARYIAPLGENWFMALRGDAGAGDTDLTWNVVGTLGFHFGSKDQYNVVFGYRHLVMEIEDDDDGIRVEAETTMSGPFAGFAFRF